MTEQTTPALTEVLGRNLTPDEVYALWERLGNAIPTLRFPEMTTKLSLDPDADPDEPEDVERFTRVVLVCPRCGIEHNPDDTAVISVDVSIRHTDGEWLPDDDRKGGGVLSFSYEGGHHEGQVYRCAQCEGIVSLPENIEEA